MWRVFLLVLTAPLAASPPVVFTSSHIGSFSTLARGLPADAAITLVQVDAHDDAMALTESRAIRARLWKEGVVQESVLRTLDAGQYIEGYNWIEPLMPHPIASLVWVAPRSRLVEGLEARVAASLNTEVRRQGMDDLDLRVVAGPDWDFPSGPWVLSVDLDFFAETPETMETTLRSMLRRCREQPPLAVTFAVSQPYQPSSVVAKAFVEAAWRAVLDETDWWITVNPRVSWGGRDRGQERLLAGEGRIWQEFDFEEVRGWAVENGKGRIVYGTKNPN